MNKTNPVNFVYCIRCECMVDVVEFPPGEFSHIDFVSLFEPPYVEAIECGLPDGFAYCPPPPFDIDQFIEQLSAG